MRRCRRGKQARAKDETTNVLDRKARFRNRVESVTACMTATPEIGPHDVERALGGGKAPILLHAADKPVWELTHTDHLGAATAAATHERWTSSRFRKY